MSIPQTDYREQLRERFLQPALERIGLALESEDEKVAFQAARWVAEMVMGRPSQAIQIDHSSQLAIELITALREAMESSRMAVPPPMTIEGNVRVLGPMEGTC